MINENPPGEGLPNDDAHRPETRENTPDELELVRIRAALEAANNEDTQRDTAEVHNISGETADSARLALEKPGFDVARYELMKRCEVRELGPEDLEKIGTLYKGLELKDDAFEALNQGEKDGFRASIRNGCYVDRWEAETPEELQKLRELNPDYIESGKEFAKFLDGETISSTRGSDFRVWGMEHPDTKELMAMAGAFLPPLNDEERMQKHVEHIKQFFTGEDFSASKLTDVDQICDRANTTAEFYIIGAKRGFGIPVFKGMLDKLAEEGRSDITDWYLLRFAGMKQVSPKEDKRTTRDDENPASGKLFKDKLGFANCGEYRSGKDVAARKTRSNTVVVVDVTWKVMHGSQDDVANEAKAEMLELHQKAREAKSDQKES